MANVYIGSIKMVGFNFAPPGYLLCQGQLLNIEGNEALFALLGTIYGGDGETTFALPDLRGRIPIHVGQGLGLNSKFLGQADGSESFTLNVGQLPSHSHALVASSGAGDQRTPSGNALAAEATAQTAFYSSEVPDTPMNAASIAVSGTQNIQPQDILPPSLSVNFIIAIQGIFPSQP